jgi:hypothetical protein
MTSIFPLSTFHFRIYINIPEAPAFMHSLSRVVVPATLHSGHLCQRPFYKIFVKFRNNKKNVLKIVLIIVNINKDENKSLISNKFSLKNDF